MAENLPSYLGDHLAGSVAALQLLDHLIETREDPADERFFSDLRADIAEDQQTLRDMIAQVGEEPVARKAAAWVAEWFGWVKVSLADAHGLGLLIALEALHLGITGKRSLWETLAAAGPLPGLDSAALPRLMARADAQLGRVADRRLQIAGPVLRDQIPIAATGAESPIGT